MYPIASSSFWLCLAITGYALSLFFSGVSAMPVSSNNIDALTFIPGTVVLDGSKLLEAKVHLRLGDPKFRKALGNLKAQADSWLNQGPWSVTNKKIIPPGGDIHDYASQAPYWWPSPTPDGCPYINRDGVRNPEVDNYTDHGDRGLMFQSSYILSLAWYYTGDAKYAKHAGDILRTWFLTPATRMNPNLNHAQIIPCANDGRSIGIIDFSQQYTSVVDAAAILAAGAPGWSSADEHGFRQWNVDFLDWLETSQFGIDETAAMNNHGTFAILQSAALALFVGNKHLAKEKVQLTLSRIKDYIQPNGSQPLELVRTRSWHYSTFDLVAYTRLADIGQKVGVDVWRYRGAGGQSIEGAINFIIPTATGESQWPYPELEFHAYAASDIIHAAADRGNRKAKAAIGKLETPPGGDLWVLRPAVEQLDAVTS